MIEQLREWFDGLAPRERWLVGVAAVLAAVSLAWWVVMEPVITQKSRAEQRLRDQQQMLVELGQLAARVGQPDTGAVTVGANQSLVVLIDRSVRERGLASHLRRNQPDGSDTIRLRLENVPFDPLVEWLAEVQTRHGLAAVSVTIDPAGERGRVNTNLVLSLTGG